MCPFVSHLSSVFVRLVLRLIYANTLIIFRILLVLSVKTLGDISNERSVSQVFKKLFVIDD